LWGKGKKEQAPKKKNKQKPLHGEQELEKGKLKGNPFTRVEAKTARRRIIRVFCRKGKGEQKKAESERIKKFSSRPQDLGEVWGERTSGTGDKKKQKTQVYTGRPRNALENETPTKPSGKWGGRFGLISSKKRRWSQVKGEKRQSQKRERPPHKRETGLGPTSKEER